MGAIITSGNIRLCQISRLVPTNDELNFIQMPIKYGVGVEKKCASKHNEEDVYYVITFVKWDEDSNQIVLDIPDNRILDIEDDEFSDYKKMLRRAINLVTSQNQVKNQFDDEDGDELDYTRV